MAKMVRNKHSGISGRMSSECETADWRCSSENELRHPSRRKRPEKTTDEAIKALQEVLHELVGKFKELIQPPEDRFAELAAKWKMDTRFVSNVTSKSMDISYQKIIGMGPAAVPLIIKDLIDNGPNDWFWALYVITDENPITDNIAGNMSEMTEAWIKWGRTKGYPPDSLQKTSSVFQAS
jgi:hypothetical protein